MSVTVKILQHTEVIIGNDVKEVGSTSTAQEIVIDGYVFEVTTLVEDNYVAVDLWTTGDGGRDNFDILILESDADVLVQLRNDAATDEFMLYEVTADVPLILTSDDMRGGTTTTLIGDGAGTGTITTLNQVDRVTVQNNVADAQGDATVTLILYD